MTISVFKNCQKSVIFQFFFLQLRTLERSKPIKYPHFYYFIKHIYYWLIGSQISGLGQVAHKGFFEFENCLVSCNFQLSLKFSGPWISRKSFPKSFFQIGSNLYILSLHFIFNKLLQV